LSTAIGKITGTGKMLKQSPEKEFNYFTEVYKWCTKPNVYRKAPEGILALN
jgi:hypothetical protein